MKFDKRRVYTALNADELKIGSKVVCANTIKDLKRKVAENEITELKGIKDECYENRFSAWFDDDLLGYALCYLVSEPEEKKLKWTDLKVGDVIRSKFTGVELLVTGIDKRNSNTHVKVCDSWAYDNSLEEWEKVDYELEEYERQVTE